MLHITECPHQPRHAHPARHQCASCGEPAPNRCAKCKTVWYCSRAHQAAHWPTHKLECKKNAQAPSPDGMCARCTLPLSSGECRVPHPVHMREDRGSICGGGESRQSYFCKACRQDYTKVTSTTTQWSNIEGAQLCFHGTHRAVRAAFVGGRGATQDCTRWGHSTRTTSVGYHSPPCT